MKCVDYTKENFEIHDKIKMNEKSASVIWLIFGVALIIALICVYL